MPKLTAKQKAFVEEYIITLNATQSAIKAGYSRKTANVVGNQNLLKPSINAAIQRALTRRSERTKVDADYVLTRLTEIDAMDVLDILSDDLQSFKTIDQWPKVWRTTISSFDFAAIADAKGEGVAVVLSKLKIPDKIRNLELLGKHTDVQSWREKTIIEHTGKVETKATVTFIGVK